MSELKEMLAARDLKLSGKKDDLIARLEAADRLSATPPPPAAPPIARKVKASAAASHSAAEFESWSKATTSSPHSLDAVPIPLFPHHPFLSTPLDHTLHDPPHPPTSELTDTVSNHLTSSCAV